VRESMKKARKARMSCERQSRNESHREFLLNRNLKPLDNASPEK
jgi:hypothetical protein